MADRWRLYRGIREIVKQGGRRSVTGPVFCRRLVCHIRVYMCIYIGVWTRTLRLVWWNSLTGLHNLPSKRWLSSTTRRTLKEGKHSRDRDVPGVLVPAEPFHRRIVPRYGPVFNLSTRRSIGLGGWFIDRENWRFSLFLSLWSRSLWWSDKT